MRTDLKLQATPSKSRFVDRVLDEAAIFLAAASFVALLMATYGLDLSPGLF
ncbi:MAG: hypothetical protein JWR73_3219 [Tardiphaga sp.]|jgi:hypothetical protein|nr:hypothetical protein [Tardiphaga sp.]